MIPHWFGSYWLKAFSTIGSPLGFSKLPLLNYLSITLSTSLALCWNHVLLACFISLPLLSSMPHTSACPMMVYLQPLAEKLVLHHDLLLSYCDVLLKPVGLPSVLPSKYNVSCTHHAASHYLPMSDSFMFSLSLSHYYFSYTFVALFPYFCVS